MDEQCLEELLLKCFLPLSPLHALSHFSTKCEINMYCRKAPPRSNCGWVSRSGQSAQEFTVGHHHRHLRLNEA